MRTGGKLMYHPEIYRVGSASTYFRGFYLKRKAVAVRKMRADLAKEIQRDIDTLLAPQNIHENFIRYIDSENDDNNELT